MKNHYPSQEELTKIINICINAVGNSCIGPVRKEYYSPFPGCQMTEISAETKDSLIKQNRQNEIHTLTDGAAFQLVQILISQLCPKSIQPHVNIDDKGF